MYVFWVLNRYIIPFIWYVPCFYSTYAYTYTAVGRWNFRYSNTTGATIGANLLDHLFFVVVLFWCGFLLLLLCLFVYDSSWSIIICMCGGCFFLVCHWIAFLLICGFGLPLWHLQTFLISIMSFYSDIIKIIQLADQFIT